MITKKEIKIRYWMIWFLLGGTLAYLSLLLSYYSYTNFYQRLTTIIFLLMGYILGVYGKRFDEYILKKLMKIK